MYNRYMIDETDYIKDSRYKKKFRATCDICNSDRGYKRKEDSDRPCLDCAIDIRNSKHNFRDPNEYSNVKADDFIIKFGNRHYKMHCNSCSRDRGYLLLRAAYKNCSKCAANLRPKKEKIVSHGHEKLRRNMKASIYKRLKSRSIKKEKSTLTMIDYSIEELKAHLESQFYPNPETGETMSWDNYGYYGWHIDHIKPDSLFKYESIDCEGFKQSWSLDNLQPLWAAENLSKNNKYDE